MRKIRILALCAAILTLVSCKKEQQPNPLDGVCGEWKLESWYGQPSDGNVAAEVYLSFSKDGSFEVFQKLGDSGHYSVFSGTYGLNSNGALYGTYTDGKSWGASYSFSVDGNHLTLENMDVPGYGTCIYLRTSIPAAVRKDAEDFSADEVTKRSKIRLIVHPERP